MKTRIISGVIIVVFFAAIIVFNTSFPLALNIAIALVSVMSIHEICNASGLTKKYMLYIPSLLISGIIPFCGILYQESLVLYSVYTLITFTALIFHYKEFTFKDLAIIYSMSILIPSALNTIVSARSLNSQFGLFYAIIAVLAAWVPDTGAYFVGTLMGKHKLCPEISPKKTVEGFVGGVLCNGIIMAALGFVWNLVFFGGDYRINWLVLAAIGIGGAVISVIGDLSFSIIKRSCGIKDFGQLIPGHGGILDRFDSVIFTAPYVYILLSFLPSVFVA